MEKVSCLMLTFNRAELFEQSFNCYCRQTYPDKELVIVSQGDEEYRNLILDRVASSGRKDIRTVFMPPDAPLGTLRNASLEASSGELVCQWDDDDLNHPDRISAQVNAVYEFGAQASFLLDHLHFFADTKQIFWCDWVRSRRDLGHAGTLLAYRRFIPPYDPSLRFGEDSMVQQALFMQGSRVALLRSLGYLYVYVYHGRNVFDRKHHQTLARWLGLERNSLEGRAEVLCRALGLLSINPPIEVVDYLEERVFTWDANGSPRVAELARQVGPEPMAFVVSNRKPGGSLHRSPFRAGSMTRRCEDLGLTVEYYSIENDKI